MRGGLLETMADCCAALTTWNAAGCNCPAVDGETLLDSDEYSLFKPQLASLNVGCGIDAADDDTDAMCVPPSPPPSPPRSSQPRSSWRDDGTGESAREEVTSWRREGEVRPSIGRRALALAFVIYISAYTKYVVVVVCVIILGWNDEFREQPSGTIPGDAHPSARVFAEAETSFSWKRAPPRRSSRRHTRAHPRPR